MEAPTTLRLRCRIVGRHLAIARQNLPGDKAVPSQYIYIWDIPRKFDQDLAVMSQIFSVIFYIKVPVEKYIPNFFHFFVHFSF